MERPSYKEQVQRMREDVVLAAVNRLLVSKGYDLMTVDEVAAEAGIAKASLYKHFSSKEQLAGAAMVRLLQRALECVDGLRERGPDVPAAEQLREVVRWALRVQLAGEMPTLPSQNSKLTAALMGNGDYMDRLMELSDKLGEWIGRAQRDGAIDDTLPPELVLFTLFARACDPVLGLLKSQGQHDDEQIVEWMTRTTFSGLGGPARPGRRAP